MAHIEPLAREDLAEFEPGFEMVEKMMGFVPNSMFTMARVPGLLPAFQGLGAAVLGNPLIARDLAQMLASVGAAREHFTDDEIAAIVAVCSFFGYLNRWNDTMATTLENTPWYFGETVIASNGWNGDRHA